MINLAKISLREKLSAIKKSITNVQSSYDSLEYKESPYAKDHEILINTYSDIRIILENALKPLLDTKEE